MALSWRQANVELVDGYTITAADGHLVQVLDDARVAIEGGFIHIEAPGAGTIQIVSAPAVKRLTYKAEEPPKA